MSIKSLLSADALRSRIKELLEDGLSDSAIIREVRYEARTKKTWPELPYRRIKDLIEALMEEISETETEVSEDSDETYEESEMSTESEDSEETYEDTAEESEDSEESYEEGEVSEDTDSEPPKPTRTKELLDAMIFFDHDDKECDRLVISHTKDSYFRVTMNYNLLRGQKKSEYCSTFYGTKEAVLEHIELSLSLVEMDDMPYKSLEFAIPFYPSIALRPSTLQFSRGLLRSVMKQYLSHFE